MVVVSILMRLTVDTAMRMFYPFLPEISRGLGITLSQGGLLMSLRSAMIFTSPVFGSWSDRRGPRLMLMGALLVQGISLWWLSTAYGLVAAIPPVILLGLSVSAFVPTLQAAISEQVPFHRRGRILGIVEFSWALTGLIILPLVGLLMVQRGWQAPLRVVAVLSLAAAPLPILFPHHPKRLGHIQHGLRQMAAMVWRIPSARANIVVTGLMFVAAEAFFVTYGAWLEQGFRMAPNQIGRVASLLGLAELSASAASSLFIDRLGKRRGVGLGLIAMTATMALLPLFERWQALAIAGMFVFTVAFEFTIVSNIGLLSDQVPLARGTVLAMAAMAGGVTRTVSDTLGVALFEWRGMQATAAYGVAGSALAVFVLYRWVQERGSEPEPAAGASDGE